MENETTQTVLPPIWHRDAHARIERILGRILWLGLALVLLFAV